MPRRRCATDALAPPVVCRCRCRHCRCRCCHHAMAAVTSLLLSRACAVVDGGILFIRSAAQLTNIIMSGCKSRLGAGIYFSSWASNDLWAISDSRFEDNVADDLGAALYVKFGANRLLQVTNTKLLRNNAASRIGELPQAAAPPCRGINQSLHGVFLSHVRCLQTLPLQRHALLRGHDECVLFNWPM